MFFKLANIAFFFSSLLGFIHEQGEGRLKSFRNITTSFFCLNYHQHVDLFLSIQNVTHINNVNIFMQVTLKTTLKRSRHKQFFWHKIDSTYDIIIMDHGETCTYVYLSSLNISYIIYPIFRFDL